MRFGGRLFAHLLYLISDSDTPSSCYSERSKAILIMGLLGLTNHESEFTLESLQVDDLQKLVLVSDQAFMNALLRSRIIRERALQLRHGFAAFSAYYKSQDKEKVVGIGNCGDVLTFENVFNSRVYNTTFHLRHLRQFCGKDRLNPTNFSLSIPIQVGSNVSPLKLMSGFKLKQLQHQLNICEKEKSSSFLESDFPVNNIRTFNERNMKIPVTIGGLKVNESGDIDSEFWKQMSMNDKRMFWTAKNKLRKAGVVFHRKEHTSQHIKSKIAMTVSHQDSISDDEVQTVQNQMCRTRKDCIIVDEGADTGLKGRLTSIFLEHTLGNFSITNFDDKMVLKCLPIGTNATKVFNSNGNAIILIKNQQIDHTGQNHSVLSVNQLRVYGVDVDDCPRIYYRNGVQGRQSMICNDIEIPFKFDQKLILLEASAATYDELKTLPFWFDYQWYGMISGSCGSLFSRRFRMETVTIQRSWDC